MSAICVNNMCQHGRSQCGICMGALRAGFACAPYVRDLHGRHVPSPLGLHVASPTELRVPSPLGLRVPRLIIWTPLTVSSDNSQKNDLCHMNGPRPLSHEWASCSLTIRASCSSPSGLHVPLLLELHVASPLGLRVPSQLGLHVPRL